MNERTSTIAKEIEGHLKSIQTHFLSERQILLERDIIYVTSSTQITAFEVNFSDLIASQKIIPSTGRSIVLPADVEKLASEFKNLFDKAGFSKDVRLNINPAEPSTRTRENINVSGNVLNSAETKDDLKNILVKMALNQAKLALKSFGPEIVASIFDQHEKSQKRVL